MDHQQRCHLRQAASCLSNWYESWLDEPAPHHSPLQMVQFLGRVTPLEAIWRQVEANRPGIMAPSLKQTPSHPPETTKRLEAKFRVETQSSGLRFDQFLPGKGRSVLATRPIEPNESLFQEHPASVILNPDSIPARCNWCYRAVPAELAWTCHNCVDAVYCDSDCAALDWSRSHRYDCGLMNYWWHRNANMGLVFHWLNRIGVKRTLTELSRSPTKSI